MRIGTLGALAAAGAAAGPPVESHRYWRVLVTAIEDGYTRVSLSEIEFWDRRHASRLAGTYSVSGASHNGGRAYDGIRQAASGATDYWISNTGTIWLKVDAGAPVELAAVVLWKSALSTPSSTNGGHIAAFDVQYSDDDSNWTTLWSEAGAPLIADANVPGLFENPYYSGDPAPTLDPVVVPRHWLKLDDGVYSDAGTTPAANDEGIAQAVNHGSEGTAFTQATAEIRPTFKTGGLNGKPFLRCSHASAQRFSDIAITQSSSSINITPYCVFAVTDNLNLANTPALLGSPATNGGKAMVWFRPNAGQQVVIGKVGNTFGDVENPQALVMSITTVTTMLGMINGARFAVSSATTFVGSALSAANLLWNDGLSGDGYFDGDLYELGYVDAAVVEDLKLFRISEYLRGKYALA